MEKMFTKEAVEEALRLTAMGCCGILSKENAEELTENILHITIKV